MNEMSEERTVMYWAQRGVLCLALILSVVFGGCSKADDVVRVVRVGRSADHAIDAARRMRVAPHLADGAHAASSMARVNSALSRLEDINRPKLVERLVRRGVARADAEDIVSNAVESLAKRRGGLGDVKDMNALAWTATQNKHIDWVRRQGRTRDAMKVYKELEHLRMPERAASKNYVKNRTKILDEVVEHKSSKAGKSSTASEWMFNADRVRVKDFRSYLEERGTSLYHVKKQVKPDVE